MRHCPDERLRAHLSRWGITERALIRRLRPGVTADVWLVVDGSDRWVAKLTYDAPEVVEWGLRAASIAAAAGVNASVARPTLDGALVDLVAWPPGHSHPLAMLRYLPGRAWRWTASDTGRYQAGVVLARLHRAWSAEQFTPPRQLLAYLADPRSDMLEAVRVRDAIDRALKLVDGSESVIYGDGLQLRRTRGLVGVLDWGTVSTAWRLFDIAIQLELDVDEVAETLAHPFIRGYLVIDPSVADEIGHLSAHRALVAAWRARYHAWAGLHQSSHHHVVEAERSLRAAERILAALGA